MHTDRSVGAIGYCYTCAKLLYPTRKRARKVTNVLTGHKAPYRCPANNLYWHIGELPLPIIRGHTDRDGFFQEAS